MSPPRKCPNCGAVVKTREMRFCGFCGTEVPAEREPPPPGPWGDLEARFDALEEHAQTRSLLRRRPSDARVVAGYGGQVVVGVLVVAIAVFIVMQLRSEPGTFLLIPAAIVVVGLVMVVRGGRSVSEVRRAPLHRVPALVVGERTEVSGGGEDSSATTTYYVTLQFRTGRRYEYEVPGRLAGRVTEGDLGLAYTKAGHLLEFARVPV